MMRKMGSVEKSDCIPVMFHHIQNGAVFIAQLSRENGNESL